MIPWEDLKMRRAGSIPPAIWNAMIDRLRAATIESFVGGKFSRGPGGGTALEASPGLGASALRTLFVTDASTEDDAQVAVSVGRIANLPLTIADVELGATPPPRLPVAETGVIYIKADFEDPDEEGEPADFPQGFEILAAAEVPDDTELAAYKVLAEVTVDDGSITVLNPVAWNFSEIQRCGATTYLWGGFGGG